MKQQDRFAFIGLLRVVAALGVVWFHLVTFAVNHLEMPWGVCRFIDRHICTPFGVMERFGFFGVAVFFLISGFIITHVALREDRLAFAVKRVFRIYPPMVLSVLLIPALWQLGVWRDFDPAAPTRGTVTNVLYSATLLNYFSPTRPFISIVTWTLLSEVTFYAITWAILPLLRSRPRVAVALGLAAVAYLNSKSFASLGTACWMFGRYTNCLMCLVMGQVVYFTWAGTFRGRDYAVFTGAALYVFVKAQAYYTPRYVEVDCSRCITLAYAYGLFVISMLLTQHIRMNAVMRLLSESSYSLYLWHFPIGMTVLLYLRHLPAGWAFAAAMAAVFAVTFLSWRLVERPSQDFARWLLARLRPTPKVEREQPAPPIRLAA